MKKWDLVAKLHHLFLAEVNKKWTNFGDVNQLCYNWFIDIWDTDNATKPAKCPRSKENEWRNTVIVAEKNFPFS